MLCLYTEIWCLAIDKINKIFVQNNFGGNSKMIKEKYRPLLLTHQTSGITKKGVTKK